MPFKTAQLSTRGRIIDAISDLFYRRGTYLVGIDEIVRELKIARATLYRHFDGKEGLIVTYLSHRHALVSDQMEKLVAGKGGAPAIFAIFDSLADKTRSQSFRGCAFLIAVTENPGSAPIQDVARTHKAFLRELFGRLVPPGPAHDEVSEQLLVVYEGVLAASVLRPEARPAEIARKAVAALLRAGGFNVSRDEA
ncbi:TetR family transcriptional regulator [Rhizobium sophoriradicis]|uniref:TetR/AcrR family transcriptional regulator n=1 Tax=Rhizobium sophoriradicis TaxID=1535245 RepID=UPI000BBD5C27|nr:TetR/AcrR family transcriptional regulator [Rhizobium sophoriradicis]PCK87998.1 TetR family transcriptional regulator [Rhizobium sophoriradicis]